MAQPRVGNTASITNGSTRLDRGVFAPVLVLLTGDEVAERASAVKTKQADFMMTTNT